MPFKKLLVLFFICVLFGCKNQTEEPLSPQIIPAPDSVIVKKENFILSANTKIVFDKSFEISGNFLKEFIANGSGFELNQNSGDNSIEFIKDESISNKEGYKLEVLKKKISIYASTDSGAFYGVQSLRQLLPNTFENGSFSGKEVVIKGVVIKDEPQYKYRGMHLDVGRHFFSVEFIKQYIDALAMLKMNTFHWHLTEDQGWRIEIKKYPKLNKIAAYRNETLIGHYNDAPQQFDGKRYGGFYTQEQIKDVVKYASSRNIIIIPEIEMPGHSQAAISAYPEFGCADKSVDVATKWGVFEEIYCTKEETFTFIESILDEVIELFPSQYIHIGGDEAPKTRWKTCNDCQKRIKNEGLKDEHELQSYFISRVEKYLNNKGRQIIGWDEILEGGLAPNATVMSWRGIDGAIKAAKEKHNVIMSPTSHCYFDYYQSDNENEPLAIGGFLPLEKVYNFNPMPKELLPNEQQYVLGAQGNVWTEYMPTEDKVEYMVFPRILAMSEVVWIKDGNKNYNDFISRLELFNKRLDVLNVNYANHLYEVEGELISKENKQYFELKTLTKDKVIKYTLDGSEPNHQSITYQRPISITKSETINAMVFKDEKPIGKLFTQAINYHKAVGKKITINVEPHKAYSGSGKEGLINGIPGSDSRYGDKEWLGFWGDDLEIEIDLGKVTEINSIETRFYNANGQWIYRPKVIEFWFDINNRIPDAIILNSESTIVNVKYEKSHKTRYIKLKIPNYGKIPEGLQGAGNKAWTFIDEIIVK